MREPPQKKSLPPNNHTEHRLDYEQPLGLKTLTDGWDARLEQVEPSRSGANANP